MTSSPRRPAIAVGLVVVLAFALGGCRYGGGLAVMEHELTNPPVMEMVNPADTPPGVTTYLQFRGNPSGASSTAGGIMIQSPGGVAALRGASADLKSFLSWQITANSTAVTSKRLAAGKKRGVPPRCPAAARITVWGFGPNVATGREWWCTRDANEVIFAKEHGNWHKVARMRGGWDCSTLDRYQVPADITAAVCWEKDERTVRHYNGPRRPR